jgi:hypothetical protein
LEAPHLVAVDESNRTLGEEVLRASIERLAGVTGSEAGARDMLLALIGETLLPSASSGESAEPTVVAGGKVESG